MNKKINFLRRLGHKPNKGKNGEIWNVIDLHDILFDTGFVPRNDINAYNDLNKYIDSTMEPFYEEKRPNEDQDYEGEIKKLEIMRNEIDSQIKELQVKKEYEDRMKEEQQKNDEYERMYTEDADTWVSEQRSNLSDMDTVDNNIKKLYKKPLGTEVDLSNLSIEQNERLAPFMKKWFEDVIQKMAMNKYVTVTLTFNGTEVTRILRSDDD